MFWVWMACVALVAVLGVAMGRVVFGHGLGPATGGALGLVIASPLMAYPVWRILTVTLADRVHDAKGHALRALMGRHFSYHGKLVHVVEDDEDERWVRLSDARKLCPGIVKDASLARLLPQGVWRPEGERYVYARADDLLRFLERAHEDRTLRFRSWLKREVYLPSRPAKRRGETPLAPSVGPAQDSVRGKGAGADSQ